MKYKTEIKAVILTLIIVGLLGWIGVALAYHPVIAAYFFFGFGGLGFIFTIFTIVYDEVVNWEKDWKYNEDESQETTKRQ